MSKNTLLLRLFVILLIMTSFIAIAIHKLYDLQVVNGDMYSQMSEQRLSGNTPIYAARGEITDRNGEPLVSNSMAFIVSFNMAIWNTDTQNDMILELIELFNDKSLSYNTNFPLKLSESGKYEFSSSTDKLFSFLSSKKVDDEITSPEQIMEYMVMRYKIDEDLSNEQALSIVSVRYQMEIDGFSSVTEYVFSEDVSDEVVAIIKELGDVFTGVVVDVKPVRSYQTSYGAHILGRVGAIQNYDDYRELGYKMNATVGVDGMEKYLEPYIRSIDGVKAIDLTLDGEVIAKGVETEPVPGNNAILTIDLDLQKIAEESLAKTLEEITQTALASSKKGPEAEGGAVVILDVNTGEVLALASYPTYNLETFGKDYNELIADPLNPLFNRAISGLYAPGSTYKMVTVLAALEEEIITPSTTIKTLGKYMYYAPSYTPACWIFNSRGISHGTINAAEALKVSCNYFMYEIGRLLTGETQANYAKKVGLGAKTGIELSGEEAGIVAGPENRESLGEAWYPGDSLASAIGQSDHLFTPIGIANYVATIANGGTVYKTHLLKDILSYDKSEVVMSVESEILGTIDIDDVNLETIFIGMNNVVNEGGTAATVFRNYPIQIAGKTGTAQVSGGYTNGLFVSFAPYENPEIAVCVVGEHISSGGQLASVVRDVYDEYFGLNIVELEE